MVIIRIMGGLGNQMFQYAFGFALAKKRGEKLYLDNTGYRKDKLRSFKLDRFTLNYTIASKQQLMYFCENLASNKLLAYWYKLLKYLLGYHYLTEKGMDYNKEYKEVKNKGVYLDGYWQSYKYFKEQTIELKKIFKYTNKNIQAKSYLAQILDANAVFIHVRRGDYLTNPHALELHGICTDEYYKKAYDYMMSQRSDYTYFIFSDEIEYVKNNMFEYVDNKVFVDIQNDVEDLELEELMLMSNCKHAIIANSSFSWWGAYLIANPEKKVVAPANWFAGENVSLFGRIPEEWLVL